MRKILPLIILLLLTSCATQPDEYLWEYPNYSYPGFFSGLFHGIVMPFSLIAEIFSDNIRIYAFPNSGGMYDFGFFLGACSWAGAAR